jgi:hypothetical protein
MNRQRRGIYVNAPDGIENVERRVSHVSELN